MHTTNPHGYTKAAPATGRPAEGSTIDQIANEVGRTNERLIRLPELLHMVCLGRTAWLDLVKVQAAPQPVKIGRATFWVVSEVQAFIAQRIRQSRGG